MKQFILSLCVLVGINMASAQDSIIQSERRNSIKLDLTSHILYRNALIISFERTVKPNQSFSLTAGYQQFPSVSRLGQGIAVRNDRKRSGSKFGGEYRFYLRNENKHQAPRGVYIGPYFSNHSFRNERTIEINNNATHEEAVLNSKLSILNLGFQVGYQFVLNNRWTIDLVFVGPSISRYRYKLDLTSTYTFDKEEIQNEIILDLLDRFPLLEDVISDKEATGKGQLNSWSLGYRYQLHFGYHFGRKK